MLKLIQIHLQEDFRVDGRSNKDYRPMELETGIVSHASGSARLRLANTDILVGNNQLLRIICAMVAKVYDVFVVFD